MLTDISPAAANQKVVAGARHSARGGYARIRRHGMLEALAVVVMLAAAAAVRLLAFLASGLLLAVLALNTSGSVITLRQAYTTPVLTGDVQALAFLEAHGATRFYTSYWVCYRLAFESQEQISCALLLNKSIFDASGGRIPQYLAQVAAAPHPTYVFDTATTDYDPGWPRQVSQEIASAKPQFADYQTARIATFIIFYYYAGP